MKRRTIFSLLGVTFALALGAIGALKAGEKIQVKEANASGTVTSSGKIYISLKQSGWTDANVKTAVYFWNTTTNGWSSKYVLDYPKYDDSNKIYAVDVPSGSWTNFKCVRVNPSKAPATPSGDIWGNDVNWGESSNQNLSGDNTFEPLISGGYRYNTTLNKLESGLSIYLDLDGKTWTDDNNIVCAYLWNSVKGTSATKLQMTNIKGWDSGNKNLYELVIPGTNDYWGNIIFYRSLTVEGTWNNQTNDLTGDTSNNVYKLSSYGGPGSTKATGSWNWTFSDTDRSTALGQCILDETTTQCASYSTNTASSFSTAWTTIKAQYDGTNVAVQNLLKGASANEGGSVLQKGAARYDYLVGKYSLNNFASRPVTPIGGSNIVNVFKKDDTASTIIIVISTLSIASLGLFLFLKKRKEER